MPIFPSAEWVAAWIALANTTLAFRTCNAGWRGVVGLVVRADPRTGSDRDLFVRLVNDHGRWSDGGISAHAALIGDARFILRAAYAGWTDLLGGRLGPVEAIVQGQVTYCGHVSDAVSPAVWIAGFTEVAERVHTEFVGDPLPPEPPALSDAEPETRYAACGALRIAYSVIGDGPVDVVIVPPLFSHVDFGWTEPSLARFLRRLSAFTRTIVYDQRGMGLSDPDPRLLDTPGLAEHTLADRAEDLEAVLRSVGSHRAVLVGYSAGGPTSMWYAATHPDRVAALILVSTSPRFTTAPGFPWAVPEQLLEQLFAAAREQWGTGVALEMFAPSMAGDRRFQRWWAGFQRAAGTPGSIAAATRRVMDVDVRNVLPQIRTPTLILHQRGDVFVPVGGAHYMAEHIPGARFIELPGPDHLFWLGSQDRTLGAVEQFVAEVVDPPPGRTGRRRRARPCSGWEALTDAELEVARLVSEGFTNREIAARLHVSARTVQSHVAHAFGKLGVSRRAELAAEASRRLGHPVG